MERNFKIFLHAMDILVAMWYSPLKTINNDDDAKVELQSTIYNPNYPVSEFVIYIVKDFCLSRKLISCKWLEGIAILFARSFVCIEWAKKTLRAWTLRVNKIKTYYIHIHIYFGSLSCGLFFYSLNREQIANKYHKQTPNAQEQ